LKTTKGVVDMSKKLLKNAYVLISADDDVEKFDILIDGDEIEDLLAPGDSTEMDLGDVDEYDLTGKLIVPGFINTHTHSVMSYFRGIADDLSLNDWLFKEMLPREDFLESEMAYYGALVSMLEMISNGITTFVDMYMFTDEIAKASYDLGIRAYISRGLSFDTDEGWNRRIKENIETYEKYNRLDNRIYIGFGPHAPYTVPMDKLKEVAEIAKKYNTHIQIHLLESVNERNQYNLLDVENTGLFDLPTIAAHCVHVDEKDIEVLSRKEVNVAYNPISNMKLGNGIAPIVDMLDKNINITFGTDSCASNNSLNFFNEMKFGGILQKYKYGPDRFSVEQILRISWENGGFALETNIGRLEPEFKADLVVLDMDSFEFFPNDLSRLKSHIVYSANPKNVFATMVAGKFLYYDGEFLTLKEEKEQIYEKFHKFYQRIEDKYNNSDLSDSHNDDRDI
jgi:5-methylthioadenosine/S-adenosylhomocysteine deaminase